MEILWNMWIICVILLTNFQAITLACPSTTCAIINSTETSIAEQVIDILRDKQNSSFTFYIQPGVYNSSNGTELGFYNFSNITIQRDPRYTNETVIQCPSFTVDGDFIDIAFVNSRDISIFDLTFTKCGPRSFSTYFENTHNVLIVNSTYSENRNNALGIRSGTNVNIVNCTFEMNVGIQNDSISSLVQQVTNIYGGAGLGIALYNISDSSYTVENCTFRNNVALKTISDKMKDSRPYNYIPFGNGGGIYLHLNNVTNISVQITNCHFYNNTALHQGGAVAAFLVASYGCSMEITDCKFADNRAVGYSLISQAYQPLSDPVRLIEEVNSNFSIENFDVNIRDASSSISSEALIETGGIGGALMLNFYGNSENNMLLIKKSTFEKNLAIGAAGVGISMRETMSGIPNGVNSNHASIIGSKFLKNYALLGGSSIGLSTNARVDIANVPATVSDCQFNDNVNEDDFRSSLFRFGINGVISTIRVPLSFQRVNQFDANNGGCININNAKVDVSGTMNFTNNTQTPLGGAMRIVGLALVQLFPNAMMMFSRNNAVRFGGAVGVDNDRVDNDLADLLNYNCFLQYNIGSNDEVCPSNWEATLSFDNNTALQGYSLFAEDISSCTSTPCYSNKLKHDNIYESSLFSFSSIFKYSSHNDTREFATAPSKLIAKNNKTVTVFPGEEFILSLMVLDQHKNTKTGFYTYSSNKLFTEADVIELDLTDENEETSFAVVNGGLDQKASVVVRNSTSDFSFSYYNSSVVEKNIVLNLVDSSTGNVVTGVEVTAKLRSCHLLYNYNSSRGKCQFTSKHIEHILRGDNISTYFYIQTERYGQLEDGILRTARIPSSYQDCDIERRLAGCLVKYDQPSTQCSEGRSGFLCGKCPGGSGNKSEVQGLAFNLLECVSCETGDRVLFVLICILIVIISILIMYYNIGLPNSLRGFLFYAQMIGYVYVSGARQGTLDWDFFLSRVFGFSFYFPLCLSHMEALQVVLFGFLPPILISMSIISYAVLARRLSPLSNKKTVDGIWFLILIAYVYTFDTCFNFLRCTTSKTYSSDFSELKFHSLVYYYDGSVTCYEDEHIIYALVAILVLIVFVLPFPFIVVAISYSYFKKAGPFCDVINTGIKSDYKWWSGYDLFRRLLFVAVYFVFQHTDGDYTQFSLSVCAIFILLVTSRIHPYNKWIVNMVEWLILLDLVLIAVYFLNTEQSVTGNSFARFLFVLPYVYMLMYLVIKSVRKTNFYKKYRRKVNTLSLYMSTLQSVMLNEKPDVTEEFEDYSPYTEYREELLDLDNYN